MAADDLLNALTRAGLLEMLRARLMKPITVPAPTAGADWTVTVPAGVVWELIAVHGRLVTSAAVANRAPQLFVRDADANFLYGSVPNSNIAASNSARVIWSGVGATGQLGTIWGAMLPVPPLVVQAGSTIAPITANIDVADQWSGVVLTVREWSPQQVASQARWIERQLPTNIRIDEGS